MQNSTPQERQQGQLNQGHHQQAKQQHYLNGD